MGIIAKSSPDGSRDVFVQSVYTGEPVSGAKVSVVAKNGTTLLSRTTGSDGHAAFPPLHDFRNEQMAVMFLAEKEGMSPSCRSMPGMTASRISRALIFTATKPWKIRAPSAAISSQIAVFTGRGNLSCRSYHPHL